MKNQNAYIIVLFLLTSLISCKKEETNTAPAPTAPAPTADFTYTGANTSAPATVFFTNTSKNASSYSWDFGDNGTSTETNPQHLYSTGGVYTVKLTAIGTGGTVSTTKTINIGSAPTKAKITRVTIVSFPFVDGNGSSWDITSGPDVYFNIIDQSNNILLSAKDSRITDVTPNALPIYWDFTTPYEISNLSSSRFIDIWDFDSPDPDDNIGYVGFNMSSYTGGSNPYPNSVTETRNGITVKLDLVWE